MQLPIAGLRKACLGSALTVLLLSACGQVRIGDRVVYDARSPNSPPGARSPDARKTQAPSPTLKPTLIEPVLTSMEDRSQWFGDRIGSGAQSSINYGSSIKLSALKALQSEPRIVNVLHVSLMPDPRDIGLIGHLAALRARDDPKLLPLMQSVEADGRALAQLAGVNPGDVTWVVEQVQYRRVALNRDAGLAAAGDQAARQRLTQLADRIDALKIAPAMQRALTSVINAQWEARMRYETENIASNTYDILRRFSFADALQVLNNQIAVDRLPALDGTKIDPNARPGCFAMEQTGWSSVEISRYRSACIPGAKEQEWYDEACLSDRAVAQMNALLTQAVLRPNIIQELRRIQDQFEDRTKMLALPLRVHGVANRYDPEKKIALCLAELKTAATLVQAGEKWLEIPPISAGFLTLTPYKAAQFRSVLGADGRRVLRLEWVFGSVVPLPAVDDSVNVAPSTR